MKTYSQHEAEQIISDRRSYNPDEQRVMRIIVSSLGRLTGTFTIQEIAEKWPGHPPLLFDRLRVLISDGVLEHVPDLSATEQVFRVNHQNLTRTWTTDAKQRFRVRVDVTDPKDCNVPQGEYEVLAVNPELVGHVFCAHYQVGSSKGFKITIV